MSRWTSVVSYHTDPETCGVARFSKQLADRLGVPFVGMDVEQWVGERPLLSLKYAELPNLFYLDNLAMADQLWHDEPPAHYAERVTGRVWKLYELGVPALVQPVHMADKALFTFGMSHKLDLEKFAAVRDQFPAQQLWISTAEHEGAGPSKVPDLMALWGPEARNLGHLSDAALALIWPRVRAFVAFFADGLRANNSSVHAALNAGVTVITNYGPDTPEDLRDRTMDYGTMSSYYWRVPTGSPYTWDRLLKELGCESSESRMS
ncbi:MAG: hypothetical protein MUE31_11725 [Candidatus Nanopelagicales bacterium]|nr:hypothetical protein [Candidatus Nanopelagicales bacterium]